MQFAANGSLATYPHQSRTIERFPNINDPQSLAKMPERALNQTMRLRLRLAMLTGVMGFALAGSAMAEGVFIPDESSTFSGVATDGGEGLMVPQTLFADAATPVDVVRFNAGSIGDMALVTSGTGGRLASGLEVFPVAPESEVAFQTRIAGESIGWGLTPYVGMSVSATPNESRIFQGIASLLPYEGETIGVQGVAGIAFEFLPGFAAGIEYSYQGYTATAPVAGDAGDNQTIMMRLDLGLN
jgi:hypothetical protein